MTYYFTVSDISSTDIPAPPRGGLRVIVQNETTDDSWVMLGTTNPVVLEKFITVWFNKFRIWVGNLYLQ